MTIEQFEILSSREQDVIIRSFITENDAYAFDPTDESKWNNFLKFLSRQYPSQPFEKQIR